jgi:hypothetical protein
MDAGCKKYTLNIFRDNMKFSVKYAFNLLYLYIKYVEYITHHERAILCNIPNLISIS